MTLVEVKDLHVSFSNAGETVAALKGISFSIHEGEILSLVGESGSGKSTAALALARLFGSNASLKGEIRAGGLEVLSSGDNELRKHRREFLAYIFQEPAVSLNPVLTIDEQIRECLTERSDGRVLEILKEAQLDDVTRIASAFPHELSGGMKQRVMIAMALAKKPKLLVADEPTTALDVTIQAEILKLLKELQQKLGLSIIYITHNFGIVKEICDRVVVMYQGRIVEEGATAQVLANPRDEYTKRLIDCLLKLKI